MDIPKGMKLQRKNQKLKKLRRKNRKLKKKIKALEKEVAQCRALLCGVCEKKNDFDTCNGCGKFYCKDCHGDCSFCGYESYSCENCQGPCTKCGKEICCNCELADRTIIDYKGMHKVIECNEFICEDCWWEEYVPDSESDSMAEEKFIRKMKDF